MTSTRDPQEPTAETVDPAATDDTAGFDVVNTTRSNIPTKPLQSALGVINPLGLGGGLVPSFESPSLGESDVAGFVATDAPEGEQPADGTADTDDTAGFAGINTTRSNIKNSKAEIAPPIGPGGGLVPSFGLPTLGGNIAGGLLPGGTILS